MQNRSKILIISISVLLVVSAALNVIFYFLLKNFDEIAGGQITIVQVLEAKLKSSMPDMTIEELKREIEVLFPNEDLMLTNESIEVCGAIFLFKNGKYYGSKSAY